MSPDRPLIRISSTFFFHLSSDHDLVPIPELAAHASTRFHNQGSSEEKDEEQYKSMKVGQQVQK